MFLLLIILSNAAYALTKWDLQRLIAKQGVVLMTHMAMNHQEDHPTGESVVKSACFLLTVISAHSIFLNKDKSEGSYHTQKASWLVLTDCQIAGYEPANNVS